jgi:CheY-like chemotaxis protein
MLTKPAAGGLVIYVDDDRDDIELMEEAFRNYPQVELLTFTESHALLNYINETKLSPLIPSLILMDVNMPLLNGNELLSLLRNYEHLKDVDMVLYTTSNFQNDKEIAKSLNAELITKPVTIAQLHETIAGLLKACHLI